MREVVDVKFDGEGAYRKKQLREYWTVIKKNHREVNVVLSVKPQRLIPENIPVTTTYTYPH
jgi:hypothetical protein